MAGLRALRLEVFVQERGVPEELELDDLDDTAIHAIACSGREVVGTGRLILLPGDEAQIGRMAVRASFRRHGLGTEVLRFLEREAKARGVKQIILHAQTYVRDFYHRRGYQEEGTPFVEAGIEHILMRKMLSLTAP